MSNTSTTLQILAILALVALLGACSEKPQTVGTHSSDTKAYTGGLKAFDAPGWKPGEKASWDEQIKQRNRYQNEYARMTP